MSLLSTPSRSLGLALAITVFAIGASAQEAPSRRVVEAPREDPPIAPEVRATSAEDLARQIAFHAELDVAAIAARQEAEREIARRHAPFDLDWGLR